MSDDTITPEVETTEEKQENSEKEVDWKAEAEKWKALSRKNEEEAKKLRPAAQKLQEIEEASKSELEKSQARLAELERVAAERESAALRAEVALAKGLTPTQAKRLVGSTREELETDADELLADLKASKPSPAPSADGQGKQGEPVGQTKQITSRDELKSMTAEERMAAYKDGRLDSLIGRK